MYKSESRMVTRNPAVCALKLPPALALSRGALPLQPPGRAFQRWKHRIQIFVSFPLLYNEA